MTFVNTFNDTLLKSIKERVALADSLQIHEDLESGHVFLFATPHANGRPHDYHISAED